MKGQEVSRRFFEEWGLPYIREHFPQLEHRVAAGLFNTSQAIGADDELSRDHNWGPAFQLFLTDSDYAEHGEALWEQIIRDAPDEWMGWRHSYKKSMRRLAVDSIGGFFKGELEVDPAAPPEDWEFPVSVESHLFFIKNGPLYYDPLGEFSAKRRLFCQWPEAFLDKKIRGCCWNMWHYGRYNFVERVQRRDDSVAAALCLGEFLNATMRLCIYFEGDFAPYWKWLPFWFRKIGWASDIIGHVDALSTTRDRAEQAAHVEAICGLAEAKFAEEGLDLEIDT